MRVEARLGFLLCWPASKSVALPNASIQAGASSDEAGVPQKPFARTVEEIFAGACLIATRYLDPFHNTATSLEETLELVGEWRKIEATNRGIAVCLGMSFWKRRQVAGFLQSGAGPLVFRRTARAALCKARS